MSYFKGKQFNKDIILQQNLMQNDEGKRKQIDNKSNLIM